MTSTTSPTPVVHGIPPRGLAHTPSSSTVQGRFGRMFRALPVYDMPDDALVRLGKAMVPPNPPGQDLDEPRGTADDDENVATLPDGSLRLPAGYTYFGQFVDHDITFDPVSSLSRQNDPDALVDFRTPRYDLDSVYGRGPSDQPYLYEPDGIHLLYDKQGTDGSRGFPDLQRNGNGRALIGDPRNDENLIVSQLQVAFIRFHNAVVDRISGEPGAPTGGDLLKRAQQQVRWHYQWVVVHDFLPRLVGEDVVADILCSEEYAAPGASGLAITKPRLLFYHWHENPYMPIEFSVAAYRYGHSVIRSTYDINDIATASPADPHIHRIPIFDVGSHADPSARPLASLGGMRPLPAFWQVDWRFFLPGIVGPDPQPEHTPQPSYKLDADLASPLLGLPPVIAGHDAAPAPFPQDVMQGLAVRNLLRAKALGVPSGQDVARAMGVTPLTDQELFGTPQFAQLSQEDKDAFAGNAPLWFYILREADILTGAAHLGPVGGRIVAEVLIGLLDGDHLSYLNVDPGWTPDLGTAGAFTLSDLVNLANTVD